MKPAKNKVFCNSCNKIRLVFESQKKADNYIRFNGEEILKKTGKAPVRSYYCRFCGGWHVSSHSSVEYGERLDAQEESLFEGFETTWADKVREKDERRKESEEREQLAIKRKAELAREKAKKGKPSKVNKAQKKVEAVENPQDILMQKEEQTNIVYDYPDASWRIQAAYRALEEGDISHSRTFLSEARAILSTIKTKHKRIFVVLQNKIEYIADLISSLENS